MKKVIPEAVACDKEADLYGIEYSSIIPVLVEAIKEQQKMIENLQSCCTNNFFKSANKATNIEENTSIEGAALYQNEPNPFSKNTVIKFSLPETVQSAFIGIYNLNGTQIKSIAVNERGNGSIKLSANELQAGMYFYSLIADGKEVDTKRMILTD